MVYKARVVDVRSLRRGCRVFYFSGSGIRFRVSGFSI